MSDGMTDMAREMAEKGLRGSLGSQQAMETPEDPWRHRSEGMRCVTCMWFVGKSPSPCLGRCRRHAPTMSGYPVVYTFDWCGDHKIDENRI